MRPSSNLQTGFPGIANHPVTRLRNLGFKISISCDNRLMSRTTATAELALLAEHQSWSMRDIEAQTVQGIRSSFTDAGAKSAMMAVVASATPDLP